MNIGKFEDWKEPEYLEFERLLRNHAQTLTSLKIRIGNCVESNTILNLPVFPALKKLHVAKEPWDAQDKTFPIKLGEDDRRFRVRFNDNEDDDICHAFLPLGGHGEDGDAGFQVCKTLRRLDLPTEATLASGSLVARAGEIARMFPNVHNPWIDKARESSETPTEQVSSN
ncbi:uncharacterized protein LOC118433261 [Folsomia candida]|uniref:uncharacterized protein LOC118433260 n=1 Tax=Folsomia candida TaxID=158441 RepID=UPI0016052080|nr:uncharacterized protein LOC118433260 [Folsomia candida]XP_035700904.1 uncharacterized protein LOC118433261 [Folsomia candida]